MSEVRLKLTYERGGTSVLFKLVALERPYEPVYAYDPLTTKLVFSLLSSCAYVGRAWTADAERLPLYARAVAAFNKRKNVCSVEAESGVLV